MKTSIQTLLSAVQLLEKLDMTSMKLSTAYRFNKIITEAKAATASFEERRVALAKKFGKLNDEGTKYEFPTKKDEEAFGAAFGELIQDEVDIVGEKIHIDLLDEFIKLTPAQIPHALWFIDGLE